MLALPQVLGWFCVLISDWNQMDPTEWKLWILQLTRALFWPGMWSVRSFDLFIFYLYTLGFGPFSKNFEPKKISNLSYSLFTVALTWGDSNHHFSLSQSHKQFGRKEVFVWKFQGCFTSNHKQHCLCVCLIAPVITGTKWIWQLGVKIHSTHLMKKSFGIHPIKKKKKFSSQMNQIKGISSRGYNSPYRMKLPFVIMSLLQLSSETVSKENTKRESSSLS